MLDWLRAWVDYQIALATPTGQINTVELPSGRALSLIGSLGLSSALTRDGEIWIDRNEDLFEATPNWRPANQDERCAVLACSQRRLYPELGVLLPQRPIDAPDCRHCAGRGTIGDIAVCEHCLALGWVSPEERKP
ncbi:hypothetical protein [Arenimonas oryziterrae]|uniref:hypothetical protein n=1 Tax=Arenimonas oryziterrae TaxID=498055 RepID=UPI0012DC34C7|nr:hypothetical protein [Arenimonas oryziterrae]